MAVDGATKEKKKKKKIKVKEEVVDQDEGNTNVMQCHDVSVQTVVKKEPMVVNEEKKKKKKKKKKVKEEVEANSPVTVCHNVSVQTTVKAERSEINISDAPDNTIKKKKRKIKEEEPEEHLVSKKKKGKKKGYEDEVEGIQNQKTKKEVEVKEEDDSVETLKKKKKKRKPNTGMEDGETKTRKRKKTEADECIVEVQKEKKKKNKKKKKQRPDDIISSETKPEKKSKKKKLKCVDGGESLPHANGGPVSSPDKKTKKSVKVKADDVIEKMEEEPAVKEERKEVQNMTPDKVKKTDVKEERREAPRASKTRDIVFLSAKPGNQDEVSIDQARRLALQMDIDKESQPKPTLGQWGTAQFDSPDRQNKFLRLMGGFKKSSQPVAGSPGSANMALGKEGQQTLQQGLLGQFERAQSHHMDFKMKGAGLGFRAPSNKTFTIDANARKSVRFDD
ncbi:lysine-rich nucleolar protein 1 [Pimephales promelas]|uniref:lysine-rich nucleolar protein 1 n=1 Tax=Pimephales promelas TaxID=90988 RepID=UPI001955805B|nr:lysine-rich nucleolar protein 1 [Pimephales promelas]XP_039540875.1 lysine-rich nucleolar protein 1 [Pimephales promelas]